MDYSPTSYLQNNLASDRSSRSYKFGSRYAYDVVKKVDMDP
jgi:hypothetical protein